MYVNIHLITGMRNGLFLRDVALLSIRPAGRGQLVNMIITLEPHTMFGSNRMLVYLNIVQQLICKAVMRLLIEI